MKRSKSTPTTMSGRIAANEMAAMVHHEMPWLPVWLATMTGSVLASVDVSRAAKKYSFQVNTRAENECRDHSRKRDRQDDFE